MPEHDVRPPATTGELLTVDEAAAMLACTPAAIRKWIYQRRVPSVKVGRLTRLRRRDVDKIVEVGLHERTRSGR